MLRGVLYFLVGAILVLGPAEALGHPVPQRQYDRTVFVRLTESAVLVEYTLALDGWTLARDLVPFSREIDLADDPQALYKAYARIYGPRIAEGLVTRVDGQELVLKQTGYQLKVEDHLRYTFQFQAPLDKRPLLARRDGESEPLLPLRTQAGEVTHRLQLTDSNFALEPGIFKIAVRGERGVVLKESTAASDPEKAAPITLQSLDPNQEEKLRTAQVVFAVSPSPSAEASGEQTASEAMPTEATAEPSLWDVALSFNVHRLLDSRFGLGLLLVLAYFFGAAHALQPGHGKTLVAAYLVGQRGTVAHAFFLGLVTTVTHTFVVILLAIILPQVYPEAGDEVAFALSLGCGLIVVLLAIWLLLRRLAGQADHVHLFGGQHHHHGPHGHEHHHLPEPGQAVTWWALVSLGVTGGLVPCVDALGLLATTVVMRKLWLGLPLILAFSAGLASVLVAVGVLVVKFKRFATSRWGEGRLVRWLPILSAVATLLLGLWMCQQALQQRDSLRPKAVAQPSRPVRVPITWCVTVPRDAPA